MESRFRSLEQQVKDNPFLEELFASRYQLEQELERQYRRYLLGKKVNFPNTDQEVTFLRFVVMVSRVYRRLSATGRNRIAGMLRSGLDAEYGQASIEFELFIATHLMKKGYDVEFSDIETGGGFDMLATRDGIEIEVECKTVSGDLGRKIHLRRLYQLGGFLNPLMASALDRGPGGQLVRVILSKRLQGSDQQLKFIYERLARVLQDGISEPGPEPCSMEYHTFSLAESPFITMEPGVLLREDARDYVEKEVGFPIKHTVMLFTPNHGAVVVAVESQQPDKTMRVLVRELKKSAKKQFTGTRPSVMCVRFSDLTEAQLVEIGESDMAGQPSALQIATSELFNRDDWCQVHTIAYFAPAHSTSSQIVDHDLLTQSVQEQGRTYFFTNLRNELAGDPRISIF